MPARRGKKTRSRTKDSRYTSEEFWRKDKALHEALEYNKKHVDKLWEYATEARERLQDLEIQVNLITRLVTTLCLDVLHIKPKMLRRLIKKVEEEAVADSEVMHLEELFKLEPKRKDEGANPPPKN